ncbi:MAG: hypothetical protein L6R42_006382, partial [Xanthoria sp. 1 TBL-2021]
MPPPFPSNEASLQPSGANVMRRQEDNTGRSQVLRPSNDTTIAVQSVSSHKQNKQNLDYVLRTGLAGGLAGCA